MSYDAFLAIITQLAGQKKARVVVQGSVIFVQTFSKKKNWQISTKIFSSEGYLPPSIKECVSAQGLLKWQEKGAYLQLDPSEESVYLIHDLDAAPKYVPFRYLMKDFIDVASEWKEILEEFANQDHISIRID